MSNLPLLSMAASYHGRMGGHAWKGEEGGGAEKVKQLGDKNIIREHQ